MIIIAKPSYQNLKKYKIQENDEDDEHIKGSIDKKRRDETMQEIKDGKTREVLIKSRNFSKTAEEMAIHRAVESLKPKNERICYDPYAIQFLSPGPLKFVELIANGNDMAKKKMEDMNSLFPGTQNSVIARVRYFDDTVKLALNNGIKQLIILGAGYDTRAYRINELEQLKVFEVDHPDSQEIKVEKIKEIFGSLPSHVKYVPVNVGRDDLEQRLKEHGYDKSKKTLFTMEGFIYYFSPELVDELLSFMVENSGKGSSVIFDYFPESVIDGTCELEVGKLMHDRVKKYGEPFKFGINEGEIEKFLKERGFFGIQNVTSEDYKKLYFHGKNENREVCSIYSFVYAVVD